jgi:orotidine-5'-phosphate decarboxylase
MSAILCANLPAMENPKMKERLIVALDLPTAQEALDLVRQLGEEVSFYKIGWQLFLTGELPRLLQALHAKQVFVDLKVPGDIGNTIKSVVEMCASMNVRFLTLSGDFVPAATIEAARAARGENPHPQFLMVPFLSSLDELDLKRLLGEQDLDAYILERAKTALEIGCEGLIASGTAIRLLRAAHPEAVIVSPGIRPADGKVDDHKRVATPAEAIGMGADYLVVGRPIRTAPDPGEAARRIIDDMERAVTHAD